jgi:trigger factor
MNIVRQDIDSLNAILKVQIAKADYSPKVEAALKNAGKTIQMPGFRKGMVPMGMIKKMHGKHLLVEEINKIAVDSLFNFLDTEKLQILGEPLPNEDQQGTINWDNDDFEFHYDIAIQPEVTLTLDKKTKAQYFKINVDDSFIDKQVESMQNQFGTNLEVDVIEDEELISANFTELDADGNVLEGGHVKENAYVLLKSVPEEYRKAFKGLTVGTTVNFAPMAAVKHEPEVISMLGLKHDNTRELNATYKVEITTIKKFIKAEINQDLFDSSFGAGVVSTEAEFRAKIKENLEARFQINSDYKFYGDFRNQLMESYPIQLPETFLKRWIIAANKDKNIAPGQIEEELPLFFEDLKWQLVKGHFIKLQNMVVGEEEFKAATIEFARMQFQQFGYYNPGDEELQHWATEIAKNKEEAKKIYDIEMDKKMITFLKETIKLDEKTVSFEEFNAMMDKK